MCELIIVHIMSKIASITCDFEGFSSGVPHPTFSFMKRGLRLAGNEDETMKHYDAAQTFLTYTLGLALIATVAIGGAL